MPSCSTSSNIKAANTIISSSDGASRLSVMIQATDIVATGLSLGDAVYYDVGSGKYTKSKADAAATAEVFGVVETIDGSGNANVVISGSIGLTGYIDISTGGAGGHDIYFLSGLTAGKLQSIAPTNSNHIIKAVYQRGPHGGGAYTGIIVNYIGYKVQRP